MSGFALITALRIACAHPSHRHAAKLFGSHFAPRLCGHDWGWNYHYGMTNTF